MINIEDVLENIDLNCEYTLKQDDSWIEFNCIGIDEWISSTPKPSYQQCIDIKLDLERSGIYGDFQTSISKFVRIASTAIFTKILDSADDKPEILLYAIVALISLLLSLYKPSRLTLMLAVKAWGRMKKCAIVNRGVTNIEDSDIDEFNKVISVDMLPEWLKI